MERSVSEKKMLAVMEDEQGREDLLDLIQYRLNGGRMGNPERLREAEDSEAADVFWDFETMIEFWVSFGDYCRQGLEEF